MKLPSIACLLVLFLLPALGAVNRWSSDGPYGGYVSCFAQSASDPDLMIAGMGLGGIWRSTNGGQNWQAVSSFGEGGVEGMVPWPHALHFVRGPQERMLVGTWFGAFLSQDGGLSWKCPPELFQGFAVNCFVQEPTAGGAVLAGTTGHGIYRSLDGGQTWAPVGGVLASGDVNSLCSDSSGHLYAATKEGIFRSEDGGLGWSKLGIPGLPSGKGLHVDAQGVVYAGTGSGFFRSRDHGDSWVPVAGSPCSQVTCIQTDPLHPGTIFAGSSTCGLFRSLNDGTSWEPVQNSALDPRASFLTFSRDGKTLFEGSTLGLSRSRDGGESWESAFSTDGPGIPVSAMLSVPDRGWLYAGTNSGLFVKKSAAGPWEHFLTGTSISSLVLGGGSPSVLYAGTSTGGLLKSVDGGVGWTAVNLGVSSPLFVKVYVPPTAQGTVYVSERNTGILRSLNGGDTWEPMNEGLLDKGVSILTGDPNQASTLYASTTSGLFRTVDGGAHWSALPAVPGNRVCSLMADPSHAGTLYAGTWQGIQKSTDGGMTWNPYGTTDEADPFLAFSLFRHPVTGEILAGGDRVMRNREGGNWVRGDGNLFMGVISTFLEDPFHPGSILAGASGVWSLTPSRDVNADGKVDAADRASLSAFLEDSMSDLPAGPWAGDVNLDGRIDLLDRITLELPAAKE